MDKVEDKLTTSWKIKGIYLCTSDWSFVDISMQNLNTCMLFFCLFEIITFAFT